MTDRPGLVSLPLQGSKKALCPRLESCAAQEPAITTSNRPMPRFHGGAFGANSLGQVGKLGAFASHFAPAFALLLHPGPRACG